MGWLFGKKDDGLYRGDAPVSAPGLVSSPYPTASGQFTTAGTSYPSAGAPYPAVAAGTSQQWGQPGSAQPLGQMFAGAGMPASGVPPELAAALRFAQNQQLVVRRTISRSLFGLLLPLVLVGGLVSVAIFVVGKVQDGIRNPFSSAPGEPFQGVVGTAGDVTLGDNTYDITIASATSQPTAAFGSFSPPASSGFLVIELSLTRTDSNASVSQISWFDWMFTPENGTAQEGELIAGGYEPLLSTLNLAPGETVTGLVAFDTPESVGTLSLTNYDGTWAQWPITATVPAVVVGAFGTPVHPEAGGTPFTATMANPRWVATGDPATWIDPRSGNYLVLDVTVTLDEGAIAETSSLSLGYDSWQFVPAGGTAVSSYIGVTGADGITFSTGQPTTVTSLICFDTPRSPGTVNLVNADGSVLASWPVPPL